MDFMMRLATTFLLLGLALSKPTADANAAADPIADPIADPVASPAANPVAKPVADPKAIITLSRFASPFHHLAPHRPIVPHAIGHPFSNLQYIEDYSTLSSPYNNIGNNFHYSPNHIVGHNSLFSSQNSVVHHGLATPYVATRHHSLTSSHHTDKYPTLFSPHSKPGHIATTSHHVEYERHNARYVKHHNKPSFHHVGNHIDVARHQKHRHDSSYTPIKNKSYPKYEFGYGVSDPYTGTHFGHSESRDGDITRGKYHVLLPDGRLQKVSYYADKTGYHPTITYERVAHFN